MPKTIEIIIDGQPQTVTKHQLFALASRGAIGPETPINVGGTLLTAEQVQGIVFGETSPSPAKSKQASTPPAMTIFLNGVEESITKQQLYDLAESGMIGPDTIVYVNGKPVPAGKAKGITFGEPLYIESQTPKRDWTAGVAQKIANEEQQSEEERIWKEEQKIIEQQNMGLYSSYSEQDDSWEYCPVCGGEGEIKVYESHRIISTGIISLFSTFPRLSCQSCAASPLITNSAITMFYGWWGIWGIFMTPIYLSYNFVEFHRLGKVNYRRAYATFKNDCRNRIIRFATLFVYVFLAMLALATIIIVIACILVNT